jgi:flagellar secretion chaperone FliS
MMNASTAMAQYKSIGLNTRIESANSHGLIEMLLDGAVSKVNEAQLALSEGQIAAKGEALSKALAIVEYLRVSLNQGIDADFSTRLGDLYTYIEGELLKANSDNDGNILDSVRALLSELREGWQSIPEDYRNQ